MKSPALLLALIATPALATDYVQSGASNLAFATQYQGETFTGKFNQFTTKLTLDPANLAKAKLNVTIQMASATSSNKDRDEQLLGSDFFSTRQFTTATFTSNSIRGTGKNQYVAAGTLKLRGVSKPVSLSFALTPTKTGAQLVGKANVKRLDFGVGGSKDWSDLSIIPNNVAVSTRVSLKKAP